MAALLCFLASALISLAALPGLLTKIQRLDVWETKKARIASLSTEAHQPHFVTMTRCMITF
jgi:hypothetical protein